MSKDSTQLRLYLMKEQGLPHPPHGEEQEFYRLVTSGDTEGIERLRENYPGGVPLSGIWALLGFSSQSHFCRRFREQTGMTSGEFRDSMI